MALNPLKTSRSNGQNVDLFEFTTGGNPGDVFRYCNAEYPVVIGGDVFEPITIERDAIKAKGREMGGSFKVTIPRSSPIAQRFRGIPARRVIFLRIFEGDLPEFDTDPALAENPTANVVWSGRVLEAHHKESTTVLSCDSLGAGMKRPGLHRFYQRECSFDLYGDRCRADKTAATTALTVSFFDPVGREIAVNWADQAGFDGDQRNQHVGGLLEFTGPNGLETRTIVQTSTLRVIVDTPVEGLIFEDDPFTVTLGCQRTPESCAALHNNIINYGGFPFIPNYDPHGKTNHT